MIRLISHTRPSHKNPTRLSSLAYRKGQKISHQITDLLTYSYFLPLQEIRCPPSLVAFLIVAWSTSCHNPIFDPAIGADTDIHLRSYFTVESP